MNVDETVCPDCAETIKAAAKVCKHCGFRITERPQQAAVADLEPAAPIATWDAPPPGTGGNDWWGTTFDGPRSTKYGCLALPAIIIAFVIVVYAFWPFPNEDKQKQPSTSQVVEQKNYSRALDTVVEAKANIVFKLKDGNSAIFDDLIVSNSGGELWALCGKVNSKNSFGGYTGFKRFVAFAHPEAPAIIEGESSGMGRDIDRKLYREAKRKFCSTVVDKF